MEYIPINIWSDFYDDGYVPDGEVTESYIYIEDSDIELDKQKEYLEFLYNYIKNNLNINGVKIWIELYESRKKYPNLVGNPDAEKMFFDRWEIRLENITHERVFDWLKILDNVEIKVDNIPFFIYSES